MVYFRKCLIVFIALYILTSFILLDFNFFNWDLEHRFLYVIASILWVLKEDILH